MRATTAVAFVIATQPAQDTPMRLAKLQIVGTRHRFGQALAPLRRIEQVTPVIQRDRTSVLVAIRRVVGTAIHPCTCSGEARIGA